MLSIRKTINGELTVINGAAETDAWINLVNPTEEEILHLTDQAKINPDFLRSALDYEERPRIETDEGQVLVLINVPVVLAEGNPPVYDTIPLSIIISEELLVTVCLQPTQIIGDCEKLPAKGIQTQKRTRFLLQILYKTATAYLRYLKQIDRKTTEIEEQLHRSMKNEELLKLLSLEKSLVYFITSLRSNELVMEKLLKSKLRRSDEDAREASRVLRMFEEDEELLEDVIIENKQAIETAEIHSNILSGMMDAFASIISNNLNIVMKALAVITIIMAIPTIIAGFYGMNVALPYQGSPFAFTGVVILSLLLATGVLIGFGKRKLL